MNPNIALWLASDRARKLSKLGFEVFVVKRHDYYYSVIRQPQHYIEVWYRGLPQTRAKTESESCVRDAGTVRITASDGHDLRGPTEWKLRRNSPVSHDGKACEFME